MLHALGWASVALAVLIAITLISVDSYDAHSRKRVAAHAAASKEASRAAPLPRLRRWTHRMTGDVSLAGRTNCAVQLASSGRTAKVEMHDLRRRAEGLHRSATSRD